MIHTYYGEQMPLYWYYKNVMADSHRNWSMLSLLIKFSNSFPELTCHDHWKSISHPKPWMMQVACFATPAVWTMCTRIYDYVQIIRDIKVVPNVYNCRCIELYHTNSIPTSFFLHYWNQPWSDKACWADWTTLLNYGTSELIGTCLQWLKLCSVHAWLLCKHCQAIGIVDSDNITLHSSLPLLQFYSNNTHTADSLNSNESLYIP